MLATWESLAELLASRVSLSSHAQHLNIVWEEMQDAIHLQGPPIAGPS